MVPLPQFRKKADDLFVVGQVYRMEEIQDRSAATHRHYFACINEAWNNLPEDLVAEYPTPEHLRKKALVVCGYADERSIICSSKAEAQRVAGFIKPMDQYAVVIVRQNVVKVFTAQSQNTHAMNAADFRKSKEAVLDKLSTLIGTDVATLKKNAEMAA